MNLTQILKALGMYGSPPFPWCPLFNLHTKCSSMRSTLLRTLPGSPGQCTVRYACVQRGPSLFLDFFGEGICYGGGGVGRSITRWMDGCLGASLNLSGTIIGFDGFASGESWFFSVVKGSSNHSHF